MKICIANIKINSISTIGSFNIGKTIMCRNSVQTSEINYPEPGADEKQIPPAQYPTGDIADPTVNPAIPSGPNVNVNPSPGGNVPSL
jgi:hypothetical protein